MALDGMQRVLEQHAEMLARWRDRLKRLETGKIRHFSEGPDGRLTVDETQDLIDAIKRDIAMIEELDKQYRP
jgi:hypothetical protein